MKAYLTEINSLSDVMRAYTHYSESIDFTLKEVMSRVSSTGAVCPQNASKQYRELYLHVKANAHTVDRSVPIEQPPKLTLVDAKSGNLLGVDVAKTELESLVYHLDILKDDLEFRKRVANTPGIGDTVGLPAVLEKYIKAEYKQLHRKLVDYLIVGGKWSESHVILLWQAGFECDKPPSPATHFYLHFGQFRILIDFYKGVY